MINKGMNATGMQGKQDFYFSWGGKMQILTDS